MPFKEIRDPDTGRLILRYDPDSEQVEVKSRQTGNKAKVYDLKERPKVDAKDRSRVKR